MDDLQKDLKAAYPVLRIQLLGVNAKGQEAGNAATTLGRELPWLQDVDANQDGLADAATLWSASYRDVYILDGNNVQVSEFDVDSNDLTQAENYAALRELLIDAAMTNQRPWRNADNPLDVNDDGDVEPIDALNIINKLNAEGPHELPPPQAGDPPLRYYDCNGDGEVGPIDALNVINHLNEPSGEAIAEGEGLPVMAEKRDLVPGCAVFVEDRDTVWPVAAARRSEADPGEAPLPKLHPLELEHWSPAVRAADEPLPDTLDGQAVRDL